MILSPAERGFDVAYFPIVVMATLTAAEGAVCCCCRVHRCCQIPNVSHFLDVISTAHVNVVKNLSESAETNLDELRSEPWLPWFHAGPITRHLMLIH